MTASYVVKKGDNLSKIAQAHGITFGELLTANPQLSRNGRSPSQIFPGEVLVLPAEGKFSKATDLKCGHTKCEKSHKEIIKKKNIVFVGSEMHYDSFWLKMMFMAPGITAASEGSALRKADITVIAYVSEDYTYAEKLPIDLAVKKFGHTCVVLASSADIVKAMSDLPVTEKDDCTERVKLQDVVFFSHGLPGKIALNYAGFNGDVDLTSTELGNIPADAFVSDGRIYSYACRTGNSVFFGEVFNSDADAHPESSLAQQMADRFGISVHAFLTRSWYGNVLRDPAHSEIISSALKEGRSGHENEVIPLSAEHEALPHPSLAQSGSSFWGTGAIGEGTNGFALWRKAGARQMPEGHSTPSGLTRTLQEFKPKQAAGGNK